MSSYLEWKRKALLIGSGGWWLPNNFDPANCVAAYLFKGNSNINDALQDLTGNNKTLRLLADASMVSGGLHVGGTSAMAGGAVTNDDLFGQNNNLVQAAVILVTGVNTSDAFIMTAPNHWLQLGLGKSESDNQYHVISAWYDSAYKSNSSQGFGLATMVLGGNAINSREDNFVQMFHNGDRTQDNVTTQIYNYGVNYYGLNAGAVYGAAAFYKIGLTQAQHQFLAERMILL